MADSFFFILEDQTSFDSCLTRYVKKLDSARLEVIQKNQCSVPSFQKGNKKRKVLELILVRPKKHAPRKLQDRQYHGRSDKRNKSYHRSEGWGVAKIENHLSFHRGRCLYNTRLQHIFDKDFSSFSEAGRWKIVKFDSPYWMLVCCKKPVIMNHPK